nr:hematopoietic progenitor cell antigen CD34 [Zonotrichia albicollis]
MEWGQLLCIFCLLELAGCAAGSPTATPTGPWDPSMALAPQQGPDTPPGHPSMALAPQHGPDTPVLSLQAAISCHSARDEGDTTGAICLQLNESSTCEHFLERKGSDLWQAVCENRTHSVESPCEIKLSPSSLDRDCLLLILKGEKDPDKLLNTLQKSHWEKLGIASLQKEAKPGKKLLLQALQEKPQLQKLQFQNLQFLGGFLAPRCLGPSSPLVTSTALPCVCLSLLPCPVSVCPSCLGTVGSPSPSPASPCPLCPQAEDPYDTENGSQGNTLLMSPSQEPAELQEKPNPPNVNGGSPEKGTGPAASQNGHSGRQHRPADTEM